MPTSSAISAATRSTPRRWRSSTSSGMLERFLERPARPARQAPRIRVAGREYDDRRPVAPRHAGAVHRDDAAMGLPRFPARRGRGLSRLPRSRWRRRSKASSRRTGRIVGVRLADGREAARGKLVIAADGRSSLVRGSAAPVEDLGAPMDVFWFRLPSARASRATRCAASVETGRMVVLIDRRDLLAVRLPDPQGHGRGSIKARGIDWIRERGRRRPFPDLDFSASCDSTSTDDLHLLDGRARPADLLASARPAGDRRCRPRHVADRRHRHQPRHPGRGRGGQHPRRAARRGARTSIALLHKVQDRRLFPTRVIQAGQKAAQDADHRPRARRRADHRAPLAGAHARPLSRCCGASPAG